MISGFNTDVEDNGVVYHVQTEDKGLETPLILSLVYTRGQILASKRTLYDDLIATGFDEKVLSERLNRQHKLLCAAIKAGRIEDIKRLGQREVEKWQAGRHAAQAAESATAQPSEPEAEQAPKPIVEPPFRPTEPAPKPKIGPLPELLGLRKRATNSLPSLPERFGSYPPGPAALSLFEPAATDGLQITLAGGDIFFAGTQVSLEILVERWSHGILFQLAEVAVMVKILGSSFRPLTFYAETGLDGYARLHVELPDFTAGRAALLVRVVENGEEVEVRRIIQQRAE